MADHHNKKKCTQNKKKKKMKTPHYIWLNNTAKYQNDPFHRMSEVTVCTFISKQQETNCSIIM